MFMRALKIAALSACTFACGLAGAAQVVGVGGDTPYKLYQNAPAGIFPASFKFWYGGEEVSKRAFLTNNPAEFGTIGSVHFATSNLPLTAAEYHAYNQAYGAIYGPLIQLPSVMTSVVIPYKKAGVSKLNLSSQQLCDVFSGHVTRWGDLLGTADDTAILVVYRLGRNAVTETFTRHMNSICPSRFKVDGDFVKARLPAGSTLPSHWFGMSQDVDVNEFVSRVDGAIGFSGSSELEMGNNAIVARINGVQPTLANMVLALSSASVPASPTYPLQWVPIIANPSSGYAIVAYTTLLVSQCYKDPAVANEVRNFLTSHYSVPGNAVATFKAGFMPVISSWKKYITANFITNTTEWNLDINNPSVCNGIGRP